MLYGTEIWWNKQKGWCENYQKLINSQGRVITDVFRSAPTGIVIRKAGYNQHCLYWTIDKRGTVTDY